MDVLVVEDDSSGRRAFVKLLNRSGYKVRAVNNGAEAFEALFDADYRAIVCDIKMPELSGRGFYEQLEAVFPHLARRVLFVTAYAADPEIHRFLVNSGQPFLEKPYDVEEFTRTVNNLATAL
ncbi:MAG: response regulator [Armatimonadota bacterium]